MIEYRPKTRTVLACNVRCGNADFQYFAVKRSSPNNVSSKLFFQKVLITCKLAKMQLILFCQCLLSCVFYFSVSNVSVETILAKLFQTHVETVGMFNVVATCPMPSML